MSHLQVRRATILDAPGIARVRVRTWQKAYRGLIPDTYLDAMSVEANTARAQGWFGEDEQALHWVCTDGDEVVGWTSVFPKSRDSDRGEGTADLAACYALEHVWGRGVGHRMWAIALDTLARKETRSVSLWVLEGNQRAIHFYERQGFDFDGSVKVETLMPDVELRELRMTYSL